jgi:hypothetical protein
MIMMVVIMVILMVMIVMVLVRVMVWVMVRVMAMVLKALSYVGWLCQCQSESLRNLTAYLPNVPQTQSFPSTKCLSRTALLQPICSAFTSTYEV